ncbi:hypothetical protein C2E23DRAFT_590014 [Lenzites betulinus]|nr:hypothetical protein C2E23DRAFT_590014 [Lenzites betulinus]
MNGYKRHGNFVPGSRHILAANIASRTTALFCRSLLARSAGRRTRAFCGTGSSIYHWHITTDNTGSRGRATGPSTRGSSLRLSATGNAFSGSSSPAHQSGRGARPDELARAVCSFRLPKGPVPAASQATDLGPARRRVTAEARCAQVADLPSTVSRPGSRSQHDDLSLALTRRRPHVTCPVTPMVPERSRQSCYDYVTAMYRMLARPRSTECSMTTDSLANRCWMA